ncbi:MAG: ParB/RepB/Spo0J family partition protein [Candidatus Limivicinus sp.]
MAAKEKRGLGIGLDALFGSDLQTEQEEIRTLPLSQVEPRQDQPRDSFDEERLQDLAASIARHGLIQPVIVRRLEGGYYQIIAGERRWRAARMAGLHEIPVRVLQADDRSVSELALVENLQREDLNPMEEARGYQKLIGDYGLTQEEAAAGVGKSRSTVTNALRLLNLCGPVAAMVENGELSAGHARALLALEDPALQEKAAQQVLQKALSVRKTELLAARWKKEAATAPSDGEKTGEEAVDYAAVVSEELSSLYGRRVSLSDRKDRGKIELYYDNAEDREALISLLRELKEKNG